MRRIVADNIRVDFPMYDGRRRSLRHTLLLDRLTSHRTGHVGGKIHRTQGSVVVTALDGISFTMQEGDRIGLMGHNGSGKTTLLRTLAGIYEPVDGEIEVQGRVTPLFSIMEGTDPDATGLETARIRALMLGLPEKDLDALIEDVAEFSELGEYLEMPVRTYSSGMMMRLAFAVVTSLRPDILLMDEVIGVGDAAFVERANRRLSAFIEASGIVVVASHSVPILQKWCNKAMVLDQGKMLMFGPVDEAVRLYEKITSAGAAQLTPTGI